MAAETDVAIRMDLSSIEKNYFKYLFGIADADKDGVIGTGDASFLRKAKLADQDLGNIWQIADHKQKGFLTEEEFYVALRMIAAVQNKLPISKETAQKTQGTLPHFAEYPPPQGGSEAASTVVHGVPSDSKWVISSQERDKFVSNFKLADGDKDGFITGVEARDLFGKSGLAKEILAKIWQLSDMDKDMKLNQTEFVVAMFLISSKMKGVEVPDTLPQSLVASAMGTAPSQPAASASQQAPASGSGWGMSPEERTKFKNIFERAITPGGPPFVTGEQAKKLFGRSGLQPIDLGKIWMLSDIDKDGKLNEEEFIIAMFLINKKLVGVDVPDSLPETLKPQVGAPTPPQESKPAVKPKGNYDIKLDELVSPPPAVAPVVPVVAPVPITNVPPVVVPPGVTQPVVSATFPALGGAMSASPAISPAVSFASFPVTFSSPDVSSQTTAVSSGPLAPLVPASGGSVLTSSGSLLGATFDSPAVVQKEAHGSFEAPDVGKKIQQIQEKRASLETKRDELSSQLKSYQDLSLADSKEVEEEEAKLQAVSEEIKTLETEIAEEKAKVATIRERLKYVRLQLKNLKDQKDQFEKVLEDKREQFREDEELHQVLEAELQDKQADIARTQREIEKIDKDAEERRAKARGSLTLPSTTHEAKEKEIKSMPTTPVQEKRVPVVEKPAVETQAETFKKPSPIPPKKPEVAKQEPVTPKPEPVVPKPEPVAAKVDPFAAPFSADFSSFSFPTDFSANATPPSPKPDKRETPAPTADPFKANANFGGWKDSPFGDDSFGAAKPNASGSEEDEDPFAFSTDLKAVSVDTQEESFGGTSDEKVVVKATPPLPKKKPASEPAPAPASFEASFDSAFDAKFDAKFDFGSDNFGASDTFGASDFGASSFGEDPSTKSEKKDEKTAAMDPSGFGADFSSAFSSGSSPFDTGADFFG